MPPAVSTTSFQKLTDSRLNGAVKDLMKSLVVCLNKQAELDGTAVFTVADEPHREWDKTLLHGMQAGQWVAEGADPGNDAPRQGYQIARRVQQYGRGTVVTAAALEAAAQGKANLKGMYVDMLAESRKKTLEAAMMLWYFESLEGVTQTTINGRNVSDIRAIDGLSFFNDGHTFLNSSVVNSNLSAVRRTLTKTNINAMQQQALGWKDWDGFPAQRRSIGLVVGDDLIGLVEVLMKSTLDPDNANNALNVLQHGNKGGGKIAGGSARHWPYMGADDFLMEFEQPMRELQGTRLAFLSGHRNKTQTYDLTNSGQAKVMEYRMSYWIGGDDPLQWITNRAAV